MLDPISVFLRPKPTCAVLILPLQRFQQTFLLESHTKTPRIQLAFSCHTFTDSRQIMLQGFKLTDKERSKFYVSRLTTKKASYHMCHQLTA